MAATTSRMNERMYVNDANPDGERSKNSRWKMRLNLKAQLRYARQTSRTDFWFIRFSNETVTNHNRQ